MSELRAVKQSDFLDFARDDHHTLALDGEHVISKKDIRGNVVYREVGYGGKKRSKP